MVDFQTKAEQVILDQKLNVTLDYITEFMRQVIENGCPFTVNHFFISMLHLETEEVNETLADYLKVIVRVIEIKRAEFNKFVDGITDKALQKAFMQILPSLY